MFIKYLSVKSHYFKQLRRKYRRLSLGTQSKKFFSQTSYKKTNINAKSNRLFRINRTTLIF